jgi:F0F1-type ATP synthase assembly protein I
MTEKQEKKIKISGTLGGMASGLITGTISGAGIGLVLGYFGDARRSGRIGGLIVKFNF